MVLASLCSVSSTNASMASSMVMEGTAGGVGVVGLEPPP